MRIAFHTPMKPPDHPRPSGDRAIARLLMRALRAAGHEVFLASRFRSFDGKGDHRRQIRLCEEAEAEAALLTRRLADRPPDLWFTYHLHYKAPDLLGPDVAEALGIPYLVAEASHAERRLEGPYALFAARALKAIGKADGIFCLTERDKAGLVDVAEAGRLHDLRPFLDARAAPRRAIGAGVGAGAPVRLLVVAMMRDGDKLQSYRLLARSLLAARGMDWRLTVVGDGAARRQVRACLAPLGARVRFAGMIAGERLTRLYCAHDIYVWPAVNEAFGIAMLQAAAHGLPVLAGAEGGVPEIIRHMESGLLTPPRDPAAMATALGRLLREPGLRRRLGQGGRRRAARFHGLSAATMKLNRVILAPCAS